MAETMQVPSPTSGMQRWTVSCPHRENHAATCKMETRQHTAIYMALWLRLLLLCWAKESGLGHQLKDPFCAKAETGKTSLCDQY